MKKDRFQLLMSKRYPGVEFRTPEITWTKLASHGATSWFRMIVKPATLDGSFNVTISGSEDRWRVSNRTDIFPSSEDAKTFVEENTYEQIWDAVAMVFPTTQNFPLFESEGRK